VRVGVAAGYRGTAQHHRVRLVHLENGALDEVGEVGFEKSQPVKRRGRGGRLVPADRGSQYTSAAFGEQLRHLLAVPSLSRPGNPYDNALAASSWSTLKTELLPGGACFPNLEAARLELAHYLDDYYNTQRLHSALGYRTPREVELAYRFPSTLAPCPF